MNQTEELPFDKLVQALNGQSMSDAVRAILQLCEHELDQAREHELIVSTPSEQRHYCAGSAGACTDLINWIDALTTGDVDAKCLESIKQRFPIPK
jgi:hypothetical protein